MVSWKIIKIAAILGAVLALFIWFASGTIPETKTSAETKPAPAGAKNLDDQYVGSEACKDCHEDKFKDFARTAHFALTTLSSWKGKVTGCESCHGPGKAHIDEADPKKIISFTNKSPKEISLTCLNCHAGKEEHNNFRRGEHWRNDVGCADCHASHSHQTAPNIASSITYTSQANAEKPGFNTVKLLRVSDPQLCLSCHGEVKHSFNMPYRHKVLEGAIRCGDCHNPHGGFETKQVRLATGADAPCIKCHTDKQGPFTYEHAPVKTEGCMSCHTPHGSPNPRLLRVSQVGQLCLECHSKAHDLGAAEPIGPSHNQNAQYANCTACHVKIHGSYSSNVFFR